MGLPFPSSGHSALSGLEIGTPITIASPGADCRDVADTGFSATVPSEALDRTWRRSLDSQTLSGAAVLDDLFMNGLGPRPLPAAIEAIGRPEATDRSSRNSASPSPSRANSSRCLISSQLFFLRPLRSFIRTRTQLP